MTHVLIFPGCLYGEELEEVPARYAALFEELGFDVTVPGAPMCCGYPYRDLGRKDLYLEHGRRLAHRLNELAPDVIVNPCPTCNRHIEKHLKRDCGLDPRVEVLHVSAFLARHLDRLPSGEAGPAVGFQDPCWLARRTGDVRSPRQVIRVCGHEVIDGDASGRFGGCCGHAGFVEAHHPDVVRRVAERRLSYFEELGVEQVVTACPRCYLGLKASSEAGRSGLLVRDLSELLPSAARPSSVPAD